MANFTTNNVSRIDKLTAVVTATIPAGTGPRGIAVDGTYAWVANNTSGTVTRIKKSDSSTTTITGLAGAFGIAVDATYCYVTCVPAGVPYTVQRINRGTANVTSSIQVGVQPTGIAVDADYVWVANRSDATVSCIDKIAWTMVDAAIDLKPTSINNPSPYGIAVDGTVCYVTGQLYSQIRRIKNSDRTLFANIVTGTANETYSIGDMTGYAFDNYSWR